MLAGFSSPSAPAAESCAAQRWATILSAVSDDLNATPASVTDARLQVEDLAADSHVANSDTVLQPLISDLKTRPARIHDANARVDTIRAFLPVSPGDCVVSFSDAKSKLGSVYASPAFANLDQKPNDLFQQIGQKVSNFFHSLFSHVGTPGTALILALVIGVLLALLIRAWLRMAAGKRSAAELAEPPATSDPEIEWNTAEAAARRGDYREAIRRAFRSALLQVAIRGRLQVDPAWTNRELLTRAGGDAPLVAALAPAAHNFENCWYGNEIPTKETWLTAKQRCQAVISLSRKELPVS